MSTKSEEIALRRKLRAEWRKRVKAMAPEMVNTFEQKYEPSFGGFPPEIQELLYADIRTLIWSFIAPFTATDENMLAIGADITVEGASTALEADALLESGGFYLRRVQSSIGSPNDWTAFLMDARFKGYNLLSAVFLNRTKVPLSLLMKVIPADEKQREDYLMQNHKYGSVMATAAAGDIFNDSQWRLQSLWDLAPDLCKRLAIAPFRNMCPIHIAVSQGTLKQDIDFDSFYETLLKTLPAEELGYCPDTVTAFEIQAMNGAGTSSMIHWASIKTRNSPNKEIIMSALREALVL